MKEDNEEHRNAHQLAAKPADLMQFDVFDLPFHFFAYAHSLGLEIRFINARNSHAIETEAMR